MDDLSVSESIVERYKKLFEYRRHWCNDIGCCSNSAIVYNAYKGVEEKMKSFIKSTKEMEMALKKAEDALKSSGSNWNLFSPMYDWYMERMRSFKFVD